MNSGPQRFETFGNFVNLSKLLFKHISILEIVWSLWPVLRSALEGERETKK